MQDDFKFFAGCALTGLLAKQDVYDPEKAVNEALEVAERMSNTLARRKEEKKANAPQKEPGRLPGSIYGR